MVDRFVHVLAFATVVSFVASAVGQVDLSLEDLPPAEVVEAPGSELHVELMGGVWLPRLDGEAGLRAARLQLGNQLDLDDLETTLNLELTIRPSERWHLRFAGFDFDVERRSTISGSGRFGDVVFADGDPFEAALSMQAYTVEVGRGLRRPRPGDDPWIGIRGIFGVHYVDVEQQLGRPGGPVQVGEGTWWGASVGLAARLQHESLRFAFAGGIGPAVSEELGFLWHVRADITWDIMPGVGVFFGYRLFEVDAEDGDYAFEAGLQGLFAGGSIRF